MKKTEVTGAHLLVEAKLSPYFRPRDPMATLLSLLSEMESQIRRHVDDVASVDIVKEYDHTCSHCGWVWTEENAVYNGGCCAADTEAAIAAGFDFAANNYEFPD